MKKYTDFKEIYRHDPVALKELAKREDRSWINPYKEPGQSLLMWTVISCFDKELSFPMFNWLLEQGADVELTNARGQTALYFALSPGALEMAHVLLDRHKDISQITEVDGDTLLHKAVIYGRDPDFLAVVKRMIPKISVNARNNARQTPLHCLLTGYLPENVEMLKMVELLVVSGANLSLQDENGDTALSLSRNYGHQVIEAYLIEVSRVIQDQQEIQEALGAMTQPQESAKISVRRPSL